MANINDLKPIQNLRPFTKFCCTIGAIPSSYLISLTYEEQLLWLCDYLKNTVIPTVNNNAEAVTELQNLYVQLKNYVDNYFTNLDVQEEINNKLDSLVEDGTLYNLMKPYFQNVDNQIQIQNQQILQNNNDINTLKSRMDTFSSLPEGSTSGNAELLDIRTGFEGQLFNSAGNAVRSQISLQNNISKTIVENNIPDYEITVPNISVMSKDKFAFFTDIPVYFKQFTPFFENKTGTFTYQYIFSDDLSVNTNPILNYTDPVTINKGASIPINDFLSKKKGLVIYLDSSDADNLYYCYNDQLQKNFPFNTSLLGNLSGATHQLINAIFSGNFVYKFNNILISNNYLLNKKIFAIGDSMVKGHSLPDNNTWLFYLASRNNMSYSNFGYNGAFLSSRTYGENTGVVNEYEKMPNDADYIIVFAGTNDIANNVPLGDETSTDTTTFFGALNVLCQGLLNKYPDKKVCFITPYARNGIKQKCELYVNAIKTACKNNGGIPVFDNISNGGIDWSNTTQLNSLTLNDSYHLNNTGMKFVSYKYEDFIRSL